MEFTCIDLIPQSFDTLVKEKKLKVNILKLVRFVLGELVESLEQFYIHNNYHLFDPHVGETSCQIRALKILLLGGEAAVNDLPQQERINRLESIKGKLDKKIKLYEKNESNLGGYIKLIRFLKQTECLFVITNTEKYLMQALFLTKFKGYWDNGENYIDHEAISQALELPKKQAKKIARYYQLSLSRFSCFDVIRLAEDVLEEQNIADLLRKLQLYDDDNRPVLPCYFFSYVLFKSLIKLELPIVVVARRRNINSESISHLVFEANDEQDYKLANGSAKKYLSKPCFVIQGYTEYSDEALESHEDFVKKFEKHGLCDIFLANMAAHPQYSGKKLLEWRNNPFCDIQQSAEIDEKYEKELAKMEKLAVEIGCCKENPTLFCTQHIFCDTLERQMSLPQFLEAETDKRKFSEDLYEGSFSIYPQNEIGVSLI